MLIAALIVGLITAYYLGLKAGGVAAGAAAALFVVAQAVPKAAIVAYAIVAIGLVGVCVIGPKVQRESTKKQFVGLARQGLGRLWRLRNRG